MSNPSLEKHDSITAYDVVVLSCSFDRSDDSNRNENKCLIPLIKKSNYILYSNCIIYLQFQGRYSKFLSLSHSCFFLYVCLFLSLSVCLAFSPSLIHLSLTIPSCFIISLTLSLYSSWKEYHCFILNVKNK